MCAIETLLASPVHLVPTTTLVPASLIFTYGTASDPPSPSNESSAESVTPKGNTEPRDNPPNLVPNVPDKPDSDPSFSDSSSSDSSDISDDEYYKQRQCAKNYKQKLRSKKRFGDPIKECAELTTKIITAMYKANVIEF